MGNYKQRSNYFESLATNNRLIAHVRPVATGSDKLRKSYFRINDLDELNAACVNWAHDPVMVHVGHDIRFKQTGTGLPRKIIGNHLYFLAKTNGRNLADEMEAAYDLTEQVMNQVIAYMNEEMEANHRCGDLFLFDLKGANAEQVGPFNNVFYGWHLTFYDETKSCELGYLGDAWFDPIAGGIDTACGNDDDENEGSETGTDAEIIYFEDKSVIEIEMSDARKAILGKMPLIQVWILEDGEYSKANVPILTDAAPPAVNVITVYNTGPATGFITLKRSIA